MRAEAADSEVIRASLSDPRQFTAIFDRHFATIHRYLARRAGADTADDLASETFTIAFARRRDYQLDRAEALPWLYGIASNLLRADARRRGRDALLLGDEAVDGVVESFEGRVAESLDARRRLQGLRLQLRALSEDDLTTLLLYAWEDLPYADIALALGVPVGTVRSRLNRVRRLLREPDPGGRASTGHNPTDPSQGG